MDTQILIGLLLTILPVFELRGGLPIVMEYTIRNGLPIWPYFLLVLLLNIVVIIFIFIFLDFLHERFMEIKWYRKVVERVLKRIQSKVRKIEKRIDEWDYFALMLLVAVPLPGTGAWTGTLIAWILGLNRIKSFMAIAAGVVVAGLIVLLLSLGFLNGFY
ncbi:MAG: small multi-drug export protein [Nanoarchaeota archaeon]|nr:small multi-drug export protein [Nanoarchaeota archaeon]